MTDASVPKMGRKTRKLLEVRDLFYVRWVASEGATLVYWVMYLSICKVTWRVTPWEVV